METFWFKWFPSKYRAATMHLTPEQDGIYRRLIDHYMETRKPLPDHPLSLARICGIDATAFAAVFAELLPFFSREGDGLLRLRTCDEVLAEQDALSQKRRASGKSGAKKTNEKKQQSGTCRPNAEQMSAMTPAREDKRREEASTEAKASSEAIRGQTYSIQFEQFWKLYPPTSGSKKDAGKSYQRVLKSGVTHETLIDGLCRYADYISRTDTPVAHATTWLNQQRWEVDYAAALAQRQRSGARQPGNPGSRGSRPTIRDEHARLAAKYDQEAQREREEALARGANPSVRDAEAIRENGG